MGHHHATMDLGLAALVADHGNGSVVPAVMAGLALAGVGLAVVVTNRRGAPIELADLPLFKDPRLADDVHHDFCRFIDPKALSPRWLVAVVPDVARVPLVGLRDWWAAAIASGRPSVPVRALSRDQRAVYQDWLLDRPEPEAREAGECLSLRATGEPFIMRERPTSGVDRILCQNIDLVGTDPLLWSREDVLDFARAALRATGHDAEALLPSFRASGGPSEPEGMIPNVDVELAGTSWRDADEDDDVAPEDSPMVAVHSAGPDTLLVDVYDWGVAGRLHVTEPLSHRIG
jgi:hypothetical protein